MNLISQLMQKTLRFYQLARKNAMGAVDSQLLEDAQKSVVSLLRQLNQEALGLGALGPGSLPPSMGKITYIDVFDHPLVTCGIFVLRKGTVLPLHDHPGMTVFSHLIFGQVECRTLHLLSDMENSNGLENDRSLKTVGSTHRARFISSQLISPSSAAPCLTIRPHINNLHEMRALTDCAFLDIIGPPYDAQERPCTYYRVVSNFTSNEELLPNGSFNGTAECTEGDDVLLEVVRDDSVMYDEEHQVYQGENVDLSQSSPGSVLSTSRSNSRAASANEVFTPPRNHRGV